MRQITTFNLHLLQSKDALQQAEQEFSAQNAALMEEMPRLYESRIQYFEPSLEALIRSQVRCFIDFSFFFL